jgi:hypothetical protein
VRAEATEISIATLESRYEDEARSSLPDAFDPRLPVRTAPA